jgi:Concanavalin A-like lectin/glucanases superfamily
LKKYYIAFCIIAILPLQNIIAEDLFYAYYTSVNDSATNYFNKDNDIIVVLGKGQQLEFTRLTKYLPLWRTNKGAFLLRDFYPQKDIDSTFDYSYVRLIENGPEKIMVQWRFIPDIKSLEKANKNLDPLIKSGLTGVVYELFTIYPDHTVLREIKDANGTKYEDWINPEHSTIEKLKLEEDGAKEISIKQAKSSPFFPRKGIEGNIVKHNSLKPLRNWNFDEGLKNHEDYVSESVTSVKCPVEGLMTLYKKGVSGTALAFDGYYSGVKMDKNLPHFKDEISLETWIALDVLPYNQAPIIQLSHNFAEGGSFGEGGFYLGVDAYGHILFRVDGVSVQTSKKISIYKWTNIAATIGNGEMTIYIDSKKEASTVYYGPIDVPNDVPLYVGLNSEKERCTDFVRTDEQNLPVILGIQGLIDEVSVYDYKLTDKEVGLYYDVYLPAEKNSQLLKGVLPGELGIPKDFGAYYKTLSLSELWSQMWRYTNNADIVIKFSNLPTSVIFWHGTNYAPSWVTDNNRWFADQSSETWSTHGCSEHMADKQVRLCRASIIENTPARVVVHWRYPCVDVSYLCTDKRNWTDEYYTIYPDGSGIRSVFWNKKIDQPGFQDDQFLTNPGESALDVMNLQAMTVANLNGDVQKLTWQIPNGIPKITVDTANIELLNSISENKVFLIFQGGKINPWGEHEQSRYTKDPFAGPWNHWPTTLIPSDGRFAVDSDRVSHFAVGGANDPVTEFGSIVQYGFVKGPIETLLARAKFWCRPPNLVDVDGGNYEGFDKSQRAYILSASSDHLKLKINADHIHPMVNPAFVIMNWKKDGEAQVALNGKHLEGDNIAKGITRDLNGKKMLIVFLKLTTNSSVSLSID